MQVINRHHLKDAWPDDHLYIGRGTPLGNPFVIGSDGNRAEVINKYGKWLTAKTDALEPVAITAMRGLKPDAKLVCSCAPHSCHGDVISRLWAERFQDDTWLRARLALHKPPRSMTYAGIGSRITPPDVMDLIQRAARRLSARGYTLRSGGADGADSAFEAGVPTDGQKEVFLPWKGFNGNTSPFYRCTDEAMDLAASTHPGWKRMGMPAKKLMARNGFQVLGSELRSPVDFVLCWTKDGAECEAERGPATGGTRQAIALASRWLIPVFNLKNNDALTRLAAFLESAPGTISPGTALTEPCSQT